MKKTTIQERFRAAAKYFGEVYKKKAGRGFQARVSEKSGITASYFSEILNGKKDGPEEVRRKLVEGIADVCDEARGLTYELFLDIGGYILTHDTPEGWQPPGSTIDWPPSITPEKPKKYTVDTAHKKVCLQEKQIHTYNFSTRDKKDKNMLLIAEWINQQDDPGEYWTLLKMFLRREEPEFKDWIKKQSSDDNLGRLPENKSVVGE